MLVQYGSSVLSCQPVTSSNCKTVDVTVIAVCVTGTHCSYPQRDGQAEFHLVNRRRCETASSADVNTLVLTLNITVGHISCWTFEIVWSSLWLIVGWHTIQMEDGGISYVWRRFNVASTSDEPLFTRHARWAGWGQLITFSWRTWQEAWTYWRVCNHPLVSYHQWLSTCWPICQTGRLSLTVGTRRRVRRVGNWQ